MTKQNSLALANKTTQKGFVKAIQEEYVKKYAQDVVVMLEDKKKLEKALAAVTATLEQVEAGNYEAIDKYKSKRKRLEYEDGFELS